MKTSELLTCAADLLEKPGAWCQGAMARDVRGESVSPTDPDAVCFCLVGAIRKCENNITLSEYLVKEYIKPAVHQHWKYQMATGFNDSRKRTQQQVVGILRKAAAYWQRHNQ